MKSGLCFLIAAKRSEISQLQQLARTSALVNAMASLVHGLQRERGLSNVFLASGGQRQKAERLAQVADCQQLETDVRACFDALDTDRPQLEHGARLFSRIAYALHGLDALPYLRQQVARRAWTPTQATSAYIKLVAGLLAVVFEAADSAADPDVSRLLVALFNFMQGKEFAGQERATGSAALASGRATVQAQQRLLHLLDSQERCLQVFHDFASVGASGLWHHVQDMANLAELERLRRMLCTCAEGASLDPNLSSHWFEVCTQRLDSMRTVESRLANDLLVLCEHRMAAAERELANYGLLQTQPQDHGGTTTDDQAAASALAFFDETPSSLPASVAGATDGLGPELGRSILELVREQSQRLQTMGAELDTVRASLSERKLVERAKGLLMAHRHLGEEEAHKLMRHMAMNQNRRVVDVAEAVLAMADVLPYRASH